MIGNLDTSEKLRLTREEKKSIRVTFKNNYFMATYGENNAAFGRYCSSEEMLKDFELHQIHRADFDPIAHYLYKRGDGFLLACIDRDL
ncbi:hypothetical protein SAMN04489760_13330 [Syntrophus gentianae]|uniref:Uncharacterized protein n=1 Tax=Syntrophus gentianae TaxID=43775 RepID=A0A1H8AD13_9BACT|nr:hypothetical protein [Syntrophus gentianae]SEM67679.1 hypothetical protein SAMN04489760_13330 [Syntrophus gentianae]